MPFYAINPGAGLTTTSGQDLVTFQTVANQPRCTIMGLHGCMAGATVSGARLELDRMVTGSSTGGSAFTPAQRDPNSIAAQTTVFTLPSAGTGARVQAFISLPQTGGHGYWGAFHQDHAVALNPNGGANGNADLSVIAVTNGIAFDYTLEIFEG